MIPFGKRLCDLLRENGISQRQFEEEIGICRKILFYERKVHKSTLMGLAYYFGITVEDLIDGTTAMNYWYC